MVLAGVKGGRLAEQTKTTVTILETAVKLYQRVLDSAAFGFLTFCATVFTLLGADLCLLYLDKNSDTVIRWVPIYVMPQRTPML